MINNYLWFKINMLSDLEGGQRGPLLVGLDSWYGHKEESYEIMSNHYG